MKFLGVGKTDNKEQNDEGSARRHASSVAPLVLKANGRSKRVDLDGETVASFE
jgi:hypothetical protein